MPQKLKFSVDPETKEVKQETKIKEDGKVVGSGRFAGSWAELAAMAAPASMQLLNMKSGFRKHRLY